MGSSKIQLCQKQLAGVAVMFKDFCLILVRYALSSKMQTLMMLPQRVEASTFQAGFDAPGRIGTCYGTFVECKRGADTDGHKARHSSPYTDMRFTPKHGFVGFLHGATTNGVE